MQLDLNLALLHDKFVKWPEVIACPISIHFLNTLFSFWLPLSGSGLKLRVLVLHEFW